jgi:MFS family permease
VTALALARPRAGFAFATYAFLTTMLGTTLPTPLYPLYEARYGIGPLAVTVIFAVYAFGVVGGLIAFGGLSDQLGRRPLLLLGLVFSAANALLFLFAGSVTPIYVARAVSGLSAGIFTGTATAFLVDLAPAERRRSASQVAVVVGLGGLGVGTLLSGLLASYGGHPLRLPYLVDLVLLVPAAAGILLAPETVERHAPFRPRLQRLGVPAEVRSVFVRAGAAGFASFAVASLFGAVAPGYLAVVLGHRSPALAGLLVFLFMGLSLGGQFAIRPLSDRGALASGCAVLLGGVALLALSLGLESTAALFASAVAGGLGQGMVIGAGLAGITQRAPVERRGETASSFFVVIYVGLSLPVIGAGLAIHWTSLKPAGLGFCAAVGLLVAGVLVSQLRAHEV